jgi:hypothetical protein
MTIKQLMQAEDRSDIRITYESRWLYWENFRKIWVVREHKRYQRQSRVLIETKSEEEAVKALLNE